MVKFADKIILASCGVQLVIEPALMLLVDGPSLYMIPIGNISSVVRVGQSRRIAGVSRFISI